MTDPRTHLARRPFPPALRAAPWHGRSDAAVVAPVPGARPTTADVHTAVAHLATSGVTEVFTAALTPGEQGSFTGAGFAHHEHLHLLGHPLDDLPERRRAGLRRGWRADYPAVLALDALAFDDFWRFDRRALSEARAATPTGRFRVAPAANGGIAGYAVVGAGHPGTGHPGTGQPGASHPGASHSGASHSGAGQPRHQPRGRRRQRTAYLQRLAVHPDHQGRGTGSALVADALWWARRRGATELLVNTQEHNADALRLYLRLGFTPRPDGLDVLRWVG